MENKRAEFLKRITKMSKGKSSLSVYYKEILSIFKKTGDIKNLSFPLGGLQILDPIGSMTLIRAKEDRLISCCPPFPRST